MSQPSNTPPLDDNNTTPAHPGMDRTGMTHVDPHLPKPALVLGTVAVVNLLIEIWVFTTIHDSRLSVAMAGALVIAMVTSLLLGNTVRAEDFRARYGAHNRADGSPEAARETMRALLPKATVRARKKVATYGMLGAIACLLAVVGYAQAATGAIAGPVLVSVLGGLAVSVTGYLGGTFVKPLD